MTVQELIDTLSQYDPNAEVRFASQPAWPFEYTITNVASAWDLSEAFDRSSGEYDGGPLPNPEGDIVYLAEGTQMGYLPGYAREIWT